MSTLDQVTQMKNQGIPEEEIIAKLKEQRISPKEINDTMNQAKIKNAVSNTEGMQQSIMKKPSNTSNSEDTYSPQTQEDEQEAYSTQEDYSPQTQEPEQEAYVPQPGMPQNNIFSQPRMPQEFSPPQQEYYPQEGYDPYSSSTGTDTDTMIEISEQVFSEKIQKIQKQLEKLNEYQTLSQVKIDSTAERLKRIETIIDNLQISILDRVGSYGKNLDNIKKEMSMMQDSFRKIPKHKKTKKHSKK